MNTEQILIQTMASTDFLFSFILTGGGITGVTDLFKESGTSKFIYAVEIPVSGARAADVAGVPLEEAVRMKFVSEAFCKLLALRAYARSKKGAQPGQRPLGIAVTAKLRVPGERKGREHKVVFVATDGKEYYSAEIGPQGRSRRVQEADAAKFVQAQINAAILTFNG